jgi:hypothetical protein
VRQEAKPAGIVPPPFDPKSREPVARNFGGNSLYSPVKPGPVAKTKPPGWAD